MLGISSNNPDVLPKYLSVLRSYLRMQVILFKPRTIDEACVQAWYLEKMDKNKGQSIGSKQKDHQDASKERKKWKGMIRRQ